MKYAPQVYALRWSWVHWWEANRDLYLRPAMQGGHKQDIAPDALTELRTHASGALLEALDDPEVEPRLAAALALGRIGAPAADGVHEKLDEVVERDSHETVRAQALLAIGMIGDGQSERFLSTYDPPTPRLRATMLLACGYLHTPSQALRDRLGELLNDPSSSSRYAAFWALAQQEDSLTENTAIHVTTRDSSPWIVSEAQIATGPLAGEDGIRMLCAVVLRDERAADWPVWGRLNILRKLSNTPVTWGPYKDWVKAYRELIALSPTLPVDLPEYMRLDGSQPRLDRDALKGDSLERRFKQLPGLSMVRGIEDIYTSRLRSSAAIGLGHVNNRPDVTGALVSLLRERDDDYNLQPKCFALISLGTAGTKEGLGDMLLALSQRDDRDHLKTQEKLESPLRGFAAIGLGLYARPYMTDQGVTDRPGYEHAVELLADRLLDKREKLEVRSACAVALGLTGRSANLKPLIANHEMLDEASPLLGGYVMLARALLGDRNLIGPVRTVMGRKSLRDETTDLMTRRAAVLALGVSGTDEMIPELIGYWDEPYFVNREVLLALSLCGVEGLTGRILPGITGDGNQYERAYYAQIVGLALERHDPPAMSRFIADTNFQFWNGLTEPYQRQANVFLYDYLIPQFEDPWY